MSERSPYRHIACAVDDSDGSRRALAEAARLWGGEGRLSVVHVAHVSAAALLGASAGAVPPLDPDWQEPGRELLEELTAGHPGAEPVLLVGDPDAQVVCDWAEEAAVDLLIAGAYRGMAARALKGSFAHHLAYHAHCPVLLVGPRVGGDAPGPGGGSVRRADARPRFRPASGLAG